MSKTGKLGKTVATFLAATLALAMPLAACGCSSGYSGHDSDMMVRDVEDSSSDYKTMLTFFGFKADSINLLAIEDILAGFMDANDDIGVVYEGAKGTTYWDALGKRADTSNLDDVFMVNTETLRDYSERGLLEDISDVSTIGHYSDLALSQCVNDDGSVYCLPMCISTYNLYINYDLLEQYGQSVPENWNDFCKVCDFFVAEGVTPIVANNYQSLSSLVIAYGMYPVYQRDDASETVTELERNPKECVETIRPGVERVAEMVERGWFDCEEVLATAQTSDDLALFAKGDRPFMITGGWASPRVTAQNEGLNFSVHPYPILDDGSVLVTDFNTCISVNSHGQYIDESKKLVEYLTDSNAIYSYCESQSSFSPLKGGKAPSDEKLEPSYEYINNGRSVIGSNYNMTLTMDSASIRGCCNLLLQGASADEVCDEILAVLTKGK